MAPVPISSMGQYGNRLAPVAKPKPKPKPGEYYNPGKPGLPNIPGMPTPPARPDPLRDKFNMAPGKPKPKPDNSADNWNKITEQYFGGKPKPAAPDPNNQATWEDADYLATDNYLKRTLADFLARQQTEKGRTGTDYASAQRDMGQQKERDTSDIREDFAARGVLNSGVYGTRLGEYNEDYNNAFAELTRRYNDQMKDFEDALLQFQRDQDFTREQSKLAAIERRAAYLMENPEYPTEPGTAPGTKPTKPKQPALSKQGAIALGLIKPKDDDLDRNGNGKIDIHDFVRPPVPMRPPPPKPKPKPKPKKKK